MVNLYLKRANRLYRVKIMLCALIYLKNQKRIINNQMINKKNIIRVINYQIKQ